MHTDNLHVWRHGHSFGQELKRPGERRTLIVIAVTGTMMAVEIVAGILTGSMALLADGLHMASHAAALGIAALAYIYARRHARDEGFTLGTGKVNALGGHRGAAAGPVRPADGVGELRPAPAPGGNHLRSGSARGRSRAARQRSQRLHPPGARRPWARPWTRRPWARPPRSRAPRPQPEGRVSCTCGGRPDVAAGHRRPAFRKYYGLAWMDPAVGIFGAVLVARLVVRPAANHQRDSPRQAGPRIDPRPDHRQHRTGRGQQGHRPPPVVHRSGYLLGADRRRCPPPRDAGAVQGADSRRTSASCTWRSEVHTCPGGASDARMESGE